MVIYTDRFVSKGFAGSTIWFIILIRPKYRSDVGLLEHERIHVKQFWRTLGLFSILYFINAKYRYKSELEAYKVQLTHSTNRTASANKFAVFLATKYRLKITQERAYNDLMGS